jgi:hypothetical protein
MSNFGYPDNYNPPPQQQYQFPWDNNPDLGKMWNDRKFLERLREWSQNMLPWDQFNQNRRQYDQDFGENQRRWNDEFGWRKQGDQFNWDMMRRQFDEQRRLADLNQGNWNKQYDLDKYLGQGNLDLGNRNLDIQDWYNRSNIDLGNRNAGIDEMWKTGQLKNQEADRLQNAENVRMQAFGRTQIPNARYLRSWG